MLVIILYLASKGVLICYHLTSGSRQVCSRSRWDLHVRPQCPFYTSLSLTKRADGSSSPRYGLSGRW